MKPAPKPAPKSLCRGSLSAFQPKKGRHKIHYKGFEKTRKPLRAEKQLEKAHERHERRRPFGGAPANRHKSARNRHKSPFNENGAGVYNNPAERKRGRNAGGGRAMLGIIVYGLLIVLIVLVIVQYLMIRHDTR